MNLDLAAVKEALGTVLSMPLSLYRDDAVDRRLAAWLAGQPEGPLEALLVRLRRDLALQDDLVASLTIHVTGWRRDAEGFDALRDEILPLLVERFGILRIWSAGCADGAEIMSVAGVAEEAGLLESCLLTATDISLPTLALAERGSFHPSAQQGLPETWKAGRGTLNEDGSWQPPARWRDRIRYQVHDLLGELPLADQHLILCRNVTIHMRDQARDEVWRKLGRALPRGGMLFVGAAEHLPAGGDHGCRPLRPFFYEKA
ncbi:MAG: CheR family methyltransferase [Candidatus Sericytochromatia bacterium]|nr:CheR family methyltransferase [Candidatus Sericytochromatia bacterium]